MLRVRNDFTASEDEHLIEYIAEENPNPAGRQGNNLYKKLEENVDNQWPWSSTHPWQSWRERYRKNQEWFEFHIKRYMKRKRNATKDSRPTTTAQPQHQVKKKAETEPEGPKPRWTAVAGVPEEQQHVFRVDKLVKRVQPGSTVAQHGGEVLQKPPQTVVVPEAKPQADTAQEKVQKKDKSARRNGLARDDQPRRSDVAKGLHMEEIPDSEGISRQASQNEPAVSDELMHELFGSSDDEEASASSESDLHARQPQQKSPSKILANGPSTSTSGHNHQLSHRSSEAKKKSQHPSQEPTPPKSNVDHSTTEKTSSPSPSSITPSMDLPDPGQRRRKIPTPSTSTSSSASSSSSYAPSLSLSPEPVPKPKGKKPKPRKKVESDYFQTASSSPEPNQVTPTREPVIVVDGPFRTTLKRPRQARRDSDSEEGRRWPPKRSKTSGDADATSEPVEKLETTRQKPPSVKPLQVKMYVPPVVGQESSRQAAQERIEQPVKQRPRPPAPQVNAIASSSKVKLPDAPVHNTGSSSEQLISGQRQGRTQGPAPPPAVPASRSGREPPLNVGGDTIAGHKTSIAAAVRHGHDQGQVQSRMEVHDGTTTTLVTITKSSEGGKVKEQKLNAAPQARAIRPEDGDQHDDAVRSHLPRSEGPYAHIPMPVLVPTSIPTPVPAQTKKVAPSAPVTRGERSPVAQAAGPRTSSGANHALPTKARHANDPFTSASANVTPRANALPAAVDKGKGRASDHQLEVAEQQVPERPYGLESRPPRKIDLHRYSLTKSKRPRGSVSLNSSVARPSSALSRRESLLSSHSRTSTASSSSNTLIRARLSRARRSSASRRSSIAQLSPEERPKFAEVAALEIADILQELADRYGVSAQIAMKTYINTGSLEYTEAILQELFDACSKREKELYSAVPALLKANRSDGEGDMDDEEPVPEGLIPDSHRHSPDKAMLEDDRTPQHQPRQSIRSASNSASPRRRPRPTLLNIKPLVVDDSDRQLSDYSPPNSSRAGQFARLEKQGRRQEALEREKRRASGIHAPQSQAPSEAPQSRERRSSPVEDRVYDRPEGESPSPHDRRVSSAQMEVDVAREETEQPLLRSTYLPSDDDSMYARTDDEFAQQMGAVNGEDQELEIVSTASPVRAIEVSDKDRSPNAMDISSTRISSAAQSHRPRNIHEAINEVVITNPKLAQQFRALASSVNKGNAAEMRKFEAETDPKVLRYLTINWVGKFLDESSQMQQAPGLNG